MKNSISGSGRAGFIWPLEFVHFGLTENYQLTTALARFWERGDPSADGWVRDSRMVHEEDNPSPPASPYRLPEEGRYQLRPHCESKSTLQGWGRKSLCENWRLGRSDLRKGSAFPDDNERDYENEGFAAVPESRRLSAQQGGKAALLRIASFHTDS